MTAQFSRLEKKEDGLCSDRRDAAARREPWRFFRIVEVAKLSITQAGAMQIFYKLIFILLVLKARKRA